MPVVHPTNNQATKTKMRIAGPVQARRRPGGPQHGTRKAGYPPPDIEVDADDPGWRGDLGTRDHARAAARRHRQGQGRGEIRPRLSTNRPPYALREIDADSTLTSRRAERCVRSCGG